MALDGTEGGEEESEGEGEEVLGAEGEEEEDDGEEEDDDGEEEDDDDDNDEEEDDDNAGGFLSKPLISWSQLLLVVVGVLIGLALGQPERLASVFGGQTGQALERRLPPAPPRTVPARASLVRYDDDDYEVEEEEEADADNGALPPGWAEHTEESSGKIFYFHADTQTSTWERPTRSSSARLLGTGLGAQQPDESLPAGWVRFMDADSGRPYYHKHTTGESTWSRPGVTLPPGWEEHYEVNAKRHYYYHRERGESTWDKPVA